MRWHYGGAALGELPWLRIRNARLSACSGWDSPGVSLAGIPAGGDGDGVRGRRSPVGGAILEPHPRCTGSLGESPVHLGRATAAPSASSPPWRRRFQRPFSAYGNAGVVMAMGGFCRWLGKAADADGWLEGGCSAFVAAAKFTPAGRGFCTGVGSCCLQRTTAAGVAWQLPVRCGTALEDGARSIDTVGRLGL